MYKRQEHQPTDFRVVGLHKNAPCILGLKVDEQCIKLLPRDKVRRIKDPYVCIAAQASSQAKYWNNGRGWLNVVKHLKTLGYRVLCIDRENNYGMGSRFNIIPYGAEDFTGRRPLQERIDLLYHADFFIGLSSGLSWVANGVGIPVSYTHLRAHETRHDLVCRLLLEKKNSETTRLGMISYAVFRRN